MVEALYSLGSLLFKLLIFVAVIGTVTYISVKYIDTHKLQKRNENVGLPYNIVCSVMTIVYMTIAVFVAFYVDHIMRFVAIGFIEWIINIFIDLSRISLLQFLWSLFGDIVSGITVFMVMFYAYIVVTLKFQMKGAWKVGTMIAVLIIDSFFIYDLTFGEGIDGYSTMDFIILDLAVILPVAIQTFIAYKSRNQFDNDC